jgi:hypothetical protein
MLQRVRHFDLYCNAENCQFGVLQVWFLGCVMTPEGVSMGMDRIGTIEDWPTAQSFRHVQVLVGFTNFY